MHTRGFALFLFLPCLTLMSQTREVTVERAHVVQVSKGADSPNINEVTGNVTVIHITCIHVTYCDSNYVRDTPGTYSFASLASDSSHFLTSKWGSPIYRNVDDGMASIFDSSQADSSVVGLPLAVGTKDFANRAKTSYLFNVYSDPSTSALLAGIDISAFSKENQAYAGVSAGRFKTFQPDASSDNSVNGLSSYTFTDFVDHAKGRGNLPLLDVAGTGSPQNYNIADYSSTEYLAKSWREMGISSSRFVTMDENDKSSYIPLSVPTEGNPWLTTSGTNSTTFWSDSGRSSIWSSSGHFWNVGLGSQNGTGFSLNSDGVYQWKFPSNYVTGTDKDSLTEEVQILSKSNKKIVGWTLITEDSQGAN